MAVICNTCGLPEDLCACGELAKDSTKIIIRLETRRFKKKGTMIEGLDPKLNNLETVAKILKINMLVVVLQKKVIFSYKVIIEIQSRILWLIWVLLKIL